MTRGPVPPVPWFAIRPASVLVTLPKFALPTVVLGLENAGELVKLVLSARSSPLNRSERRNFRNSDKSRSPSPGPETLLCPRLPQCGVFPSASTGCLNCDVSNHRLLPAGPATLCSTMNSPVISGVNELPGVLLLTVVPKVIGKPVISVRTPFTCQSPKIQLAGPLVNRCFFGPNGSSQRKLLTMVWLRSKSSRE